MAIRTSIHARRLLASALGVAALSIAFVTLGGAANAATARAQSCSYDLGAKSLVCVDAGEDLNKAVLEQAHLQVVAPSGARGTSASAALAPAGVQATFVQSQLYDDANYGGSFFQITNSAACNGSTRQRRLVWTGQLVQELLQLQHPDLARHQLHRRRLRLRRQRRRPRRDERPGQLCDYEVTQPAVRSRRSRPRSWPLAADSSKCEPVRSLCARLRIRQQSWLVGHVATRSGG